MLTAYSRVTVVSADRTIDLALPSSLPLSDVLPQLMHFAAPDGPDGQPATWTLARLGGSSLLLSQTLADAGVLDGDVLELRLQHDDVRPATVEDVRDAVEDSVDASGGVWSTPPPPRSWSWSAAPPWAARAGEPWPPAGVASALALRRRRPGYVAGGRGRAAVHDLVVGSFARDVDAQCAAGRCDALGRRVRGVRRLLPRSRRVGAAPRPSWAWASPAASPAADPGATGHAAFGVVVAVARGRCRGRRPRRPSSTWQTPQAIRVVPVLAVLAVGVLPRVSLSVGGLASADYRVRHVGRLDLATLRRAIARATRCSWAPWPAWRWSWWRDGAALDLNDRPWDRRWR